MSEPAIVAIPNGQFVQNGYLLADAERGEAVVIDPGEEADRFLEEAERRGWRIGAIWLTHAHLDHMMGVARVHQATGAPIWLHPADRPLYEALPQQGTWAGIRLDPPPPPDHALSPGTDLTVGGHRVEVRATPGHSPGSVSFLIPGHIFGGDVLFHGSIGRPDLPGGDLEILLQTIRSVFLSLPDDTVIHSGHGPDTTVGVERRTNPFLTGALGG